MRKQLVHGKKVLLFIDTGDNCRCPLAVGYLRKLLREKGIDYIDIRHAGVMCPNDLLPTPEVVLLLQEEGEDIRKHRSRPLTLDLISQADLILGMTPIHVQKCIRWTEEAKGKTFLLKEYVGFPGKNVQIPDPMGGTMEIFKKCYVDMKQSLHKLLEMEFITTPPDPEEVTIVTGSLIGRQIKPDNSENASDSSVSDDKSSEENEPKKKVVKSAVKAKSSAKDSDNNEVNDDSSTDDSSKKRRLKKTEKAESVEEVKDSKPKGKVSAKSSKETAKE